MNIWIIGGSTGIGLALAKQYTDKGDKVWISARNVDSLNKLCDSQFNLYPVPMDMTNDDTIVQAITQLKDECGTIDKVIINAGTCEYIDSYTIERDKIRRVMETNFFGAINVVYHVLPLLRLTRQKKSGFKPQLVFVSSSVTYLALPRAGAYGASKAALRYFAETLRADLIHENIDVRVVSPGFVDTPLTSDNDFPMPFLITSENAAKRIINGLQSGKFDISFPKRFTWILKFIALLPNSIRMGLISKLSRHDQINLEKVNE